MSNIPLNTIQNILTNAVDRQHEDSLRAQRVIRRRQVEHAEQVEDSTEFGVTSIDDKGDDASQQQKKKQQQFRELLEEKVELQSLEDTVPEGVDVAAPAKPREVLRRPEPPKLDLSA